MEKGYVELNTIKQYRFNPITKQFYLVKVDKDKKTNVPISLKL